MPRVPSDHVPSVQYPRAQVRLQLTISYSGPGQQHAALDSVEAGEELEEDRRALLSLEQNIGRTPEMNFSSIISRCLVYHGAQVRGHHFSPFSQFFACTTDSVKQLQNISQVLTSLTAGPQPT